MYVMMIVVNLRLSTRGGTKKILNATMNKTTALGEQFGTSDFLCGCWDE